MAGVSSLTEIRDDLLRTRPVQWPVLLGTVELRIARTGEFPSLRDFITTPVQKGGLGMTVERVAAMLDTVDRYRSRIAEIKVKLGIAALAAETPAIAEHGGAREQVDNSENVNLNHNGGNQARYRIARLKRDYPDIAERLEGGEFKTVRAAERAAGMAVPEKLDKVGRLVKAFMDLQDADRQRFIEQISQLVGSKHA